MFCLLFSVFISCLRIVILLLVVFSNFGIVRSPVFPAARKSFGTRVSVTLRKQRFIYTSTLNLPRQSASETPLSPRSRENAAKKLASVPQRQQSLGGNASETRGLRDTLWYTVPRRDCPSVPCACIYFFTSRSWRVFVLALFSLEAPSLACMAGPVGGENLRLLARSSRPFGRSPSWKYCPPR